MTNDIETGISVELLQHSKLDICAHAIRTCWQSFDKSDTCYDDETNEPYWLSDGQAIDGVGPNDKALVDRVSNKFKHSSTLEHLNYTFYISGISRAVLQELARHRMASPSVKSTRYTLKELKNEQPFMEASSISDTLQDVEWSTDDALDRAKKYLVFTGVDSVDIASIQALDNLRDILNSGISNDKAKLCLPESYKTELTWTINARSLQNFISLRSAKAAFWEIRLLARAIYNAIPSEHKYLFENNLNDISDEIK